LVGVAAPLLFPAYTNQVAVLWLMIIFASTWDILGGQMGYNSLGNIFFFGAGMYASAVVQIGLFYDVGMYTSGGRTTHIVFTTAQYFTGFAIGTVAAAIAATVLALLTSWIVFGLRGPYFAIGTLGVAVAGAELIASWEWVGAAAGISMPVFPGNPQTQKLFFYFLLFGLAFVVLIFLRWLYSTNFGLAINAIRDDEEKAEAMGLYTRRYKRVAWSISAFFLGIAGAIFGNMTGFVEPRDIAFPTTTFNIFMILMVLLGGKGTFWGPVVGAVVFQVIKEVTWTYFLGWQFVTLGLLIVIIVVYFQQGIVGWLMEKYPARFGIEVAPKDKDQYAPPLGLAPHPGGAE
jgi:branched-chain amino acid transport system permease protein